MQFWNPLLRNPYRFLGFQSMKVHENEITISSTVLFKNKHPKKKKKAKKAALDLYLGETVAPAFQAELF